MDHAWIVRRTGIHSRRHAERGDRLSELAAGAARTALADANVAAQNVDLVLVATVTSDVSFIKLFGLGLAMAVVMDATLIRGILVPAFMRLAGEANWWAPKPLHAFYERFGFSEGGADEPEPHAVVARDYSERYRTGMVKLAEQASEAELHALLTEENLTVTQLMGWGAKLKA